MSGDTEYNPLALKRSGASITSITWIHILVLKFFPSYQGEREYTTSNLGHHTW